MTTCKRFTTSLALLLVLLLAVSWPLAVFAEPGDGEPEPPSVEANEQPANQNGSTEGDGVPGNSGTEPGSGAEPDSGSAESGSNSTQPSGGTEPDGAGPEPGGGVARRSSNLPGETRPTITGFHNDIELAYTFDPVYFVQGSSVAFQLSPDCFVWSGSPPDTLLPGDYAGKLSVEAFDETHIERVDIDADRHQVRVAFKDVSPAIIADFSTQFTLAFDGESKTTCTTSITGTALPAGSEFAVAGETYFAPDNGIYVYAQDDIEGLEIYFDNGMYTFADLPKGALFTAAAGKKEISNTLGTIVCEYTLELDGNLDTRQLAVYFEDYFVDGTLPSHQTYAVYNQAGFDPYEPQASFLGYTNQGIPYADGAYYISLGLFDPVPRPYRIVFDASGGTGAVPQLPAAYLVGEPIPLPKHTLEKPGYVFGGWGISNKSSWPSIFPTRERFALRDYMTKFADEDNVITLYAVWSSIDGIKSNPLQVQGSAQPGPLTVTPGGQIRFSVSRDAFHWVNNSPLSIAVLDAGGVNCELVTEHLSAADGDALYDLYDQLIAYWEYEETENGVDLILQFTQERFEKNIPFQFSLAMRQYGEKESYRPLTITGVYQSVEDTTGGSNNNNNGRDRDRGRSSGNGPRTPSGNTSPAPARQPVSATIAVTQTRQAVQQALSAGGASATVRVQNASEISLDTMRQMAQAAAGANVYLSADSVVGSAVDVRIRLNPALATADIKLAASTTSPQAVSTAATFGSYYSNKLAVVSFEQTGGFGQTVRVAAKLDLTGMDTGNLAFYAYNRETNSYRRIEEPAYSLDSSGYLHFDTTLAGDIIVSDGPLVKK